jgi:hypothetical protein
MPVSGCPAFILLMRRFGVRFMETPPRFLQDYPGGFMQYRCAVLFLCLFFCASASPQSGGNILCDPASMTSVPAWIEPGMPHVVQQLPCGQIVKVTGLELFPIHPDIHRVRGNTPKSSSMIGKPMSTSNISR